MKDSAAAASSCPAHGAHGPDAVKCMFVLRLGLACQHVERGMAVQDGELYHPANKVALLEWATFRMRDGFINQLPSSK